MTFFFFILVQKKLYTVQVQPSGCRWRWRSRTTMLNKALCTLVAKNYILKILVTYYQNWHVVWRELSPKLQILMYSKQNKLCEEKQMNTTQFLFRKTTPALGIKFIFCKHIIYGHRVHPVQWFVNHNTKRGCGKVTS